MIKRNLIANYIGQGWRALMSLLFVPVYIKYIGIEAYGLIGIFAMLQAWLSLLDMGMKPALVREMSRYTGGGHNTQSIWDLLRSIEIIVFAIAFVVSIGIWGASDWLATDWVKAKNISTHVSAQAFSLMGIVTALQFVESIYSSSLTGLQRQVLLNTVLSIMATIRSFGALGVLIWVSHTIKAFFFWQVIISSGSLLISMAIVYRALPLPPRSAQFSKPALQEVFRFARGIVGITLMALMLTQVDKLLLSKMLTLEAFGYYSLAGLISGILYMFASPVTAVYFPRFNELLARNDDSLLIMNYHQAAQLVTVTVGSVAVVLIIFAEHILFLWTNDSTLTQRVTPIMSVLAFGTFLNCLMWIPYQMQLANGWTSLAFRVNIVFVSIFVPLILWLIPIYGAIGAAWIWVALNSGYCVFATQFMYKRILKSEKWRWYVFDVIIPISGACITGKILKILLPIQINRIGAMFEIICVLVIVLVVTALFASSVRVQLIYIITKALNLLHLKIKNRLL